MLTDQYQETSYISSHELFMNIVYSL